MNENSNSGNAIQQLYRGSIRVAEGVCTIVTTPIEYFLRPFFGTRYFEPVQMMFTWLVMMALPILGQASAYLPVGGDSPGLVGLGTLSTLFFLSHIIHGPRLWRRVLRMELEGHSEYEGEALPFFARLPYGHVFWVVRIFWEPAFVALVGIMGHLMRILDRPAMIYLIVCSLMLMFKNYLSWYQSWLQLRTLMDAKYTGPLIAKAVSGKATEKELAQVHMAGFVGSVPEEIRAAAIAEMAPRTPTLPPDIARLLSPVEPPPRADAA
jgi:hypothetical protein